MIKLKDPIIFGILSSAIIYYILYLEIKKQNKKEKVSIRLPIIVGIITWASTSYFDNDSILSTSQSEIPDLNQDIYTDPADF